MPAKAKPEDPEPGADSPGTGKRNSGGAPGAEDGRDSRARILDAAERLMAERGYAGTSISAIVRASGLPASSVYWHFSSKRGLLAAVMERAAESWLARFRSESERGGLGDRTLGGLLARAAPDVGRPPTEFLRLLILLALERREADAATLDTIRRVRRRALELVRGALFETFRDAGEAEAHRIADACSAFVLAFGEGLFIARQIDPQLAGDELPRQLERAVLALGEAQLRESPPAREARA